jgi:hypothetical protein
MNSSLRFGKDFIRSKASSRVTFSRFGRSIFGCFFSSFIGFSSKCNEGYCQYFWPFRVEDLNSELKTNYSVAATFVSFGE